MKYKITFHAGAVEEVEADFVRDSGHEGRWIDFAVPHANDERIVLRVETKAVRRVERVTE